MADAFENHSTGITGPAVNSASITPSDSVDLAYVTRAISVDVSGNVAYHPVGTQGDASVTRYVAQGVQLAIRARRILATGTTATGIVADW